MENNTKNEIATGSLIADLLQEKRTDRLWRNIRFACWFFLILYIVISIAHLCSSRSSLSTAKKSDRYIALVRLNGIIAAGRKFSAEEAIPILNDAFADKNAEGVVIDIDSPGGTPVQSSAIHDAILTFKKKYNKKVIIVGEDLLTSGAYFVAVAADKIYVNPNTLTGSIGVIMKGFGFVDLIKKMGIERRVYTAGNNKDRLDPFLPPTLDDEKKIQAVMTEVHNNFAQAVLVGRKGRLHAEPDVLFSGDFWSGQSAYKLGLVDGLGNLMDVMEKEFKTSEFKEYGGTPTIFRLINGQMGNTFDHLFNTLI